MNETTQRTQFPEGNAIVYCEGAFTTTTGKTAHGLVRKTDRYRIAAVIDSSKAGQDAGTLLDGAERNIPVVATLDEALEAAKRNGRAATHFVIGLAPCGGRLRPEDRAAVRAAIGHGLNVDSGLHDFLVLDSSFTELANANEV